MVRRLLDERGIKDMQGIQGLVKELTAGLIQEVPDAGLGYSAYGCKNKSTSNSRNGYAKKTVKSSQGKIGLNIPRGRESEFTPQSRHYH